MRSPRRTLRRRRAGRSGWHWLLLAPIVLPLWTPTFNRFDPQLAGIPFFYWGQLAMVFLAMIVIWVVHMLTRNAGG